ncbi:putative ribonuclease YokI [compost metagenome]
MTTAKAAVTSVTSAKTALTSTAKAVASTTKAVASTAKAAAVSTTKAVVNAAKPVVASAKNILSESKKALDITRKQDTPLARSINQTVGIAEGAWSFGKSTVTGIASAVAHPIETVKGLGQAVAHPIQTGKAIGGAISTEWSKNVTGDSADTRSRAKFVTESVLTIGSFFVGAGELKALATASKVEKTVEAATVVADVAKAGTTASKVANVIPEVMTSAPRPGRLKLDLQHFASHAGYSYK